MNKETTTPSPSGLALVPFAVFAAFYVGLSLFASHLGYEMPWYKVSMPIAFLVASAVSLIMGRGKLDEKVEIYARGMGVAKGLDISVDTVSLLSSLYYQPLLALSVFGSMLLYGRRNRGDDSVSRY